MKVTIPNPDRPAELSEIEQIMSQLQDCNVRGGWNMGMLDKWLRDKPDQVWRALESLNNAMDDLYPPTVIEVVQATEEARKAS